MSSEANRSLLSDYGLSSLPGEWTCSVVGDFLKSNRGISVGVMYPGVNCPGGIPLIKAGDIRNNWINSKPDFSISVEKHQEYIRTELEGGELLISLVGNAGQTAVVPKEMSGWNAARAVAVLRLEDEVDPVYLQYCLQSPSIQALIKSWCNTTVQETLNLKEIKKVPFPLPGMGEQKGIAHILGTLGDKIELNRKTSETLEGIAKALFKSWLVDFDPVRAKADGRSTGLPDEISKLFPDSFEASELGEIPSGWKVSTLGEENEIVMGQSPPGHTYNEEGIGLPFYQGRSDFGFRHPGERVYCSEPSRLAKEGSTLMSVRAPVGSINMADKTCCVGRGVASLRSGRDNNAYTYYLMDSIQDLFDTYNSEGTVFGAINKKDLSAIKVVQIPEDLEKVFEKFASRIDRRISLSLAESAFLTSLRDVLLPRLISGELRVPDAEKMLEEAGV